MEVPSIHEISRILLKARRLKKIKQEVLSATVGCSRSYISKLEKGSALLSFDLAGKLEKALNLKNGKLSAILQNIKRREANLRKETKQAVQEVRSGDMKFILADNTLLPLYSLASSQWTEKLDRYIAIPSDHMNGHKAFFLRAHDDSMDLAGVSEGDILLIEIRSPKNGDICVYCVGKERFARRHHKDGKKIVMTPESSKKKYEPASYYASQVSIKGVATRLYLVKPKR